MVKIAWGADEAPAPDLDAGVDAHAVLDVGSLSDLDPGVDVGIAAQRDVGPEYGAAADVTEVPDPGVRLQKGALVDDRGRVDEGLCQGLQPGCSTTASGCSGSTIAPAARSASACSVSVGL